MPEISRFFGIVITMHFAGQEHNPPHFHVEYSGNNAVVSIEDGVIFRGKLPSRESRLVLAWNEINKDELLHIWNTQQFKKIKPLG